MTGKVGGTVKKASPAEGPLYIPSEKKDEKVCTYMEPSTTHIYIFLFYWLY